MKTPKITILLASFFLTFYIGQSQTNCAPFTLSQGDIGVSSETFGVSLADFDGDGWNDVVTIDAYDYIEVYFNNGDGTFNTTPTTLGGDYWRFGVQVLDIENDGDWDFITVPFSSSSGNGIEVWENNGSGNFSLKNTVANNTSGYELAVGDLNADGYTDIFYPHGDVSILLNDGAGNFVSNGQTDIYVSSPEGTTLADLDNDSDLDAVIVRGGGSGFVGKVFFNDGTGQFTDSGQELAYGCEGVSAGDIDGDGDLDLAIAPWNGSVELWTNDGLGNFLPESILTEADEFYNDIILADYNYDGHPDIFTDKQIWLNDTNNPGNFIMQDFEMNASNHDFEVIDINNDDILDIYLGRFSSGNGDSVYLSDEPTFIDVNETICFGESIFLQNDWQTEAGVYYDYADCNELTRTTLSVYDEIDTTITDNDGTLTVAENGADYQWLDCNNGNSPISGETSQSFTPTSNGNYAVEVTQNGICVVVSDCYMTSIGIDEHTINALKIYPNPTTGILKLSYHSNSYNLSITDITGRIIYKKDKIDTVETEIDLSKQPTGVYFVKVLVSDRTIVKKFIKK